MASTRRRAVRSRACSGVSRDRRRARVPLARHDDPAADDHRALLGRVAHDAADPPHRRRPLGGRRVQGRGAREPRWYENLKADPHATIEVMGEEIPVRASTASGEERTRLWSLLAEAWPAYDDYQQKTDREIPVVVLTRR